jgi:hypothetical protein
LRPTTNSRSWSDLQGILAFVQASTKEVVEPMPSGAFASPSSSLGLYSVVVFPLIITTRAGSPKAERAWAYLEIASALLLPADVLIPGLVESVGNILVNDIVGYQFDVVRKIRMLDGQRSAQHIAGQFLRLIRERPIRH